MATANVTIRFVGDTSRAERALLGWEAILALATLTEREREAFIDRVILGRTCREVGESMNVTASRVNQLQKQAQRKLERRLECPA